MNHTVRWNFSLFIKKGIDGPDRGLQRATKKHEFHRRDISCLSEEKVHEGHFIKDQKAAQERTTSPRAALIPPLHNVVEALSVI